MPAPTITALPTAPSRSDAPATFVTEAEAFVEALEGLPGEINEFGSYLDGLGLEGTSWKGVVRCATTSAGTLATGFENGDAIDGVTLATGNRILIKNQATASENGIYVVAASGAPSRATDCDTGAEMLGLAVIVAEGTTNADTLWFCTTNATITIGSTSLAFSQIGGTASVSETSAGTETAKAVTPDGLAGSRYGTAVITILVSDPNGSAITTGDGKAYFRVPSTLNGMNLVAVAAALTTVSSSGTPTIQIHNLTQAADMLSTRITIDASETDSSTAAAAAVIDTGNDDVVTGDMLRIDIDVAGTGAKGLMVEMQFQMP